MDHIIHDILPLRVVQCYFRVMWHIYFFQLAMKLKKMLDSLQILLIHLQYIKKNSLCPVDQFYIYQSDILPVIKRASMDGL